jgi:putative chitinase
MTNEQLATLGIDSKWLQPLEDTFAKYDINTPERQAAFIGQCAHESGNFKTLEENLNYKPEALMRVWPSRFPDLETAMKYAHNQEAIANKVYGGRMGNGVEETGEGWKYHGRGLIQLTGKENYANCGSGIGVDLLSNPNLLNTPEYAALSAGWFWNKKGLNALADAGDFETMTKRINGGLIGLDDRKAKIAKALSVLG